MFSWTDHYQLALWEYIRIGIYLNESLFYKESYGRHPKSADFSDMKSIAIFPARVGKYIISYWPYLSKTVTPALAGELLINSFGLTEFDTWRPFHKKSMNSNYKSWKTCLTFIRKILTPHGHDFAHATTALLSWHVRNCDLMTSLDVRLCQNAFSKYIEYKLIIST